MLTGNEFQTLRSENRKARDPKIDCDGELKADENWMSAGTSWVHDNARGQRYGGRPVCKALKTSKSLKIVIVIRCCLKIGRKDCRTYSVNSPVVMILS